MEMNTRLQVEHPVTEMISGQDLVEWQLRVAAGETLPRKQEELKLNGHAFEARIYAEDPNNDFLPATGQLSLLKTPVESEHVRIDTGVRQGDEVSVFYDPMIAKLIVWDENREKALQRLAKALREYRIDGVTTNIEFLYNLATTQAFANEEIDTGFIEKNHQAIFHKPSKANDELLAKQLPIAALYLVLSLANETKAKAALSNDPQSPWHNTNAWRLNEAHCQTLTLAHNDIEYAIEVEQKRHASASYYLISITDENNNQQTFDCQGEINGEEITVTIDGHRSQTVIAQTGEHISLYQEHGVFSFNRVLPDYGQNLSDDNHGGLTAPMNGTMVSVLVAAGEQVKKDQPLVIMEAMKMEHTIKAPSDGIVDEVYFNAGDMVDGGAELLAFSVNTEED